MLPEGMSQQDMLSYLQSCPQGRPLRQIETDLKLPEPEECNVPASDWPLWKLKYFTDGLDVGFLADYPEACTDDDLERSFLSRQGLIYTGDPWVRTEDENWRVIHETVAGKRVPEPPDPNAPKSEMDKALDRLEAERAGSRPIP